LREGYGRHSPTLFPPRCRVGWRRSCVDYRPIVRNAQGGEQMGQSQQKLIVEDDAELRNLTAALFEDEQLEIIECESAEAALLIGGRKHEPIHLEGRERTVRRKSRWQPTTHTAQRHGSAYRSRSA
jgi:hypothetical protein